MVGVGVEGSEKYGSDDLVMGDDVKNGGSYGATLQERDLGSNGCNSKVDLGAPPLVVS